MSLWIDKYRPKKLDKLDYHTDQAQHLKNLVQSKDMPHLLVHGPSGAGKKTRVTCILRELYGSASERLRLEHPSFENSSKKKIEITTLASNFHIEVNPSDAGINDKLVIQEILKATAQAKQLDSSKQRSFKVVVLTEVDQLTQDAQQALRRTMESYMSTCRLILVCNSTSKVIPALRSRCLLIRVSAPTEEQISSILLSVCKKERLSLPPDLATKIAQKSNRNLRRALLMCEACRVQQYPFSSNQRVSETDWEVFLRDTANAIVQQQTPQRLFEIRQRIYELLAHCIPPDVIMKGLVENLIGNIDGQLKQQVSELAAQYEHRINLGSKPVFHIEAFVAKFMAIYKQFLDEGMADFF